MFLHNKLTINQWFLTICVVFAPIFSIGQTAYIKRYKPLADSLAMVAGIPASVILGVAGLESGFGTSRNAKLLLNHFGVKGKNKLWKTKRLRSSYKQYPSVKDSYIDFVRIIKNKRFYTTLKGNIDFTVWIAAISKSGYSEMPIIWSERVTKIIIKNKLETL
jgi:flagellum-specific peptidoglycan hydrolase FlgJ